MSKTLPKARFANDRSSFAVIDPSTELFYRKEDRHSWLNNPLRPHIAISYVWSEWKCSPSDRLPDWGLIRKRLLYILGPNSSSAIRLQTGNASCCWLDSKCIDQYCDNSKLYWIPRMDQIYAEVKCTVLLLRGSSFSILMYIAQGMRCNVRSKSRAFDWPHRCLLSQCCTTLPTLSVEQEKTCIQELRILYDGTWRKRAWIFQEILLSEKYLLSVQDGDCIDLSVVGVIANLILQRNPDEIWLMRFSDWCRRLFHLRRFFIEAKFHHLSDANVLQMATGLEASVPADKIYALCAILRLKNIPYNVDHSTDEAFQVVVGELVKRGRLSWLYAISPPLKDDRIHLGEANRAPFVLTRLNDIWRTNPNKMHFSRTSIEFPVFCIGEISQTKPLAEVLEEASEWIKEHDNMDFPPELQYLFFVPKIIRRIALDVVNPLLTDPLFIEVSLGLGVTFESGSRPSRVWRVIMALCTKETTSPSLGVASLTSPEEISAAALANSAARSLQDRLQMIQDQFLVIWWRSHDDSSKATLGLGPQSCRQGDQICSIKDDEQLLLAASFLNSEKSSVSKSTGAYFRGMIYDLNTVRTIEEHAKFLFVPITYSATDIQGPLFGDHSYKDKYKDCGLDKYIRTDMSRTVRGDFLSLFGRSYNQKGKVIYLNLLCSS